MRVRWLLVGLLGLLAAVAVWALAAGGGTPETGAGPAAAETGGTAGGGGRGPGFASEGGGGVVTWTWSADVDAGGGHVGPWRMNRSEWRYVDDPTVALDGRGRAAVAWVDQARKDVLFRRYGPGGEPEREAPVNVSRSPGVFSWLPRMVVARDDPSRIYVLWQEIVFSGGTHGGEAFFARSTDGGRTFGDPVNLSRTEAGAGKGRSAPRRWQNGSLDLARGPGGSLYAAWTVYEGGLWVARSDDRGVSFSAPLRVTTAGGAEPARAPSLAVGPEGTVHLVWAVGGRPAADLRHATSTDGGRSFGDPRVLFPGGGHADAPKIASGAGGALHLAWAESPPGRIGDHRVRYARAPAGGGFGEPRDVAAPGGDGLSGLRFPHLDLDGEGDPWLLWERYREGRRRPRGLGLTASTDGGRSFADATVVPGTADPAFRMNGSLQGHLMRKLAVNAGGEVAVVNSSFEPGEASRIRLVRGRAAGR